ncbi:MAG: class I SAM-dependent methyltransferase [Thermodesulfobacteriota bacterium]
MACRELASGSVLDVGAYYGDFLKMAAKNGREISGTEINQKRVDLANSILAKNCVRLDFRNGKLSSFQEDDVDNTVCTEVIEHVPDDRSALKELCRVTRKKVIVTVPFKETINKVLCVHCSQYTPYSGHLHTYDFATIENMVPEGWVIRKKTSFAKKMTFLLFGRMKLPAHPFLLSIMHGIDMVFPGDGRWLLLVLTPVTPK